MSNLLDSFFNIKPEKDRSKKGFFTRNFLGLFNLQKGNLEKSRRSPKDLILFKRKLLNKEINLKRLGLMKKSYLIDKKFFLTTKGLMLTSVKFGLSTRMNKIISSILLKVKLDSPAMVRLVKRFFIRLTIAMKDVHSLDVPSGRGLPLSRADKMTLMMLRTAKFQMFLFLEKMRNEPLRKNIKEKIALIELAKTELEKYEKKIFKAHEARSFSFGSDFNELMLCKMNRSNVKNKDKKNKKKT